MPPISPSPADSPNRPRSPTSSCSFRATGRPTSPVRTSGSAAAQLPFAGLHQLFRRVGPVAPNRSTAQDALLTAVGMMDGPPPERFLIAHGAMSLLEALATESPIALLADDAQWLDSQTQEIL